MCWIKFFDFNFLNDQSPPVWLFLGQNGCALEINVVTCLVMVKCNAIIFLRWFQYFSFVFLLAPVSMFIAPFLDCCWCLANVFLWAMFTWNRVYYVLSHVFLNAPSFSQENVSECLCFLVHNCESEFFLQYFVQFLCSWMEWDMQCICVVYILFGCSAPGFLPDFAMVNNSYF